MRPLQTMHDVDEFCEVYFDDVAVPADRMLGKPGDGWRLAMDLLPYERSTCFWQRIAYLYSRFDALIGEVRGLGTRVGFGSGRGVSGAAHAALPVAGHPAPARRRPQAGSGHVDRQGVAGRRRTEALRHRPRSAAGRRRTRRAPPGAPSTCTRGRPPSTAAPPRCSATSSPAGCWTSGRSDRGRRLPNSTCSKTVCARPCCRPPAPNWTRRWPSSAGPTCCPTCPSMAIPLVFRLLGETGSHASVLNDVVVHADRGRELGEIPELPVRGRRLGGVGLHRRQATRRSAGCRCAGWTKAIRYGWPMPAGRSAGGWSVRQGRC